MRRQREMKMKSLWYGEKGVRGESPIINSEACGECRESQGSPSKAQASRWRKRNKNREEIFPARERSEQGLKFPRFVAGAAFHTCAALGYGGIATPMLLVLFSQKSTEIHDTVNDLYIEGVVRVVILYCSAFVYMRFFTAFRMTGALL